MENLSASVCIMNSHSKIAELRLVSYLIALFKPTMNLRFFLLLSIIVLAFPKSSSGQQYEHLRLSDETPEIGQRIQFVYSGIFSRKIDSRITMYYANNRGIAWQSLVVTHQDGKVQGSFVVPDSTLAFCLKPRNNRDTVEAFIFNVYKAGKLLKGSLAAGARFYANSVTHAGERDDRAKLLYLKEFAIHPEIKAQKLLDYYEAGCLVPDPVILSLFQNTWRDSLTNGKSEVFLSRLYYLGLRYRDLPNKELLRGDILAKYPNGEVALTEEMRDYRQKIQNGTFGTEIIRLEQKYPGPIANRKLESVYIELTKAHFDKLHLDSAMRYLEKIKIKINRRDVFLYGARRLLKDNIALKEAQKYVQQAIAIQDSLTVPNDAIDKVADQSYKESLRGQYLSILASIKYQMGDTAAALLDLSVADGINKWDEDLRVNYVHYLLQSGNPKKALEVASKYVVEDRANAQILSDLKLAYLASFTSGNFEQYYQQLIATSEKQYKLPEYSKMNVAAPDFTLSNLKGNQVSLKNFKGKGIVLYFFSPNYPSSSRNEKDSIFNVMATTHGARKDLVFLGIDKTQIFEQDEVKREVIRTDKLKEFMMQRNYQFEVLLDKLNYNSKNSGFTYFSVADDYSSGDMSQFYIIDKAGMVKYKSYGGTNFQRELKAALALAQ